MNDVIQLEAKVTRVTHYEGGTSMTLRVKGALGINDVLTIPACEGAAVGDRYVCILSPVRCGEQIFEMK